MKPVVILLLALNVAGCSYLEHTCHNVVSAPIDTVQEYMLCIRLHRIARETWSRISCQNEAAYSKAYAQGFEAGFVDYVDRGGTGEAPASPPVHMQRKGLRDTVAQQEIEDWFAGFRHGAAVAIQSGLRESILIPIGVPPRQDAESISAEVQPYGQPINPDGFGKSAPTGYQQNKVLAASTAGRALVVQNQTMNPVSSPSAPMPFGPADTMKPTASESAVIPVNYPQTVSPTNVVTVEAPIFYQQTQSPAVPVAPAGKSQTVNTPSFRTSGGSAAYPWAQNIVTKGPALAPPEPTQAAVAPMTESVVIELVPPEPHPEIPTRPILPQDVRFLRPIDARQPAGN